MKITDIFKRQEKTFSFEFFPPKGYSSTLELGINIGQLIKLAPSFISVTYGAGGTTQDLSFDLIEYIQHKIGITAMAHYTCINASKTKVESDLDMLFSKNILNLMLLRGDLPQQGFKGLNQEFRHASDLIALARSKNRYCIGAAGYPEKHPESLDIDSDLKWLKNKVDQGADFIITQMFFDNDHYFNFVDKARRFGIKTRIIPGIMPITNFKQIKKFSEMCGATIPQRIITALESIQHDSTALYSAGVDFAIEQCVDLLKRGAPGLHFYTLNKSRATVDIFSSLPHALIH
ncbi:MAG: methylenetetrahydrofolate reductase [NAD(P)H] [Cyclobacteriaceae bacterium]|nr:methylenetetrahydrofolate reductase [NAD(P)H] [Cyclobacteriaceae bacterium]